jgi:hypothetical protein
MDIVDKLTEIASIIKEIETEDPGTAGILREGFGLALNIIEEYQRTNDRSTIDISEHLRIVTSILGVSVKDLVMHIIQSQPEQINNKEPDPATLEFITSDLDDYEKFLAQNSAKESLDFLKKSV